MGTIRFVLAIHNHQPVGNFDHVIEDAYQRAYEPFLQAMEGHPAVKFVLHQPGILWEWMHHHHPEYLEKVQLLVDRQQLELLSGGYYEPILPVIPEADRLGQIRKLTAWLHQRFGVEATGGWLAERVWEPHLAESIHRAGLQYVVVDDSHFLSAGHRVEELDGHFITEENGHLLRLFPIRQRLRYSLPFSEPEETLSDLRRAMQVRDDAVLVHADDGEKFGVWPGTQQLCYEDGWLERFLVALEDNQSWLKTATFAECLEQLPSRGRTYLPTASYAEMMEWALPPEAQRKLHQARERVAGADDEALQSFVRGGFWRNFLSRYTESNWMHKKMLYVSRKRRAAVGAGTMGKEALQQASDDLWAGQCNCAYWHGLFGGLYLPHLRSEIYRRLIRSEVALDAAATQLSAMEVIDFDADGSPEVLLRSEDILAIVQPHQGGAVFELDDRRRFFNVLDLMARREEAYHDRLRDHVANPTQPEQGDAAVSIHDRVAVKEEGLEKLLFEDRHRRGCFVDHVITPEASLESFCSDRLPESFDLVGASYGFEEKAGTLVMETEVKAFGNSQMRLCIRKCLRVEGATLTATYEISAPEEPVRQRFAIEMAANLLAGDAMDRRFEVPGHDLPDARLRTQGVLHDVSQVDLVDEYLGLRITMTCDVPADLWRFPVESVSMSEAGFERIYQGSALLFVFPFELSPGMIWQRRIQVSIASV